MCVLDMVELVIPKSSAEELRMSGFPESSALLSIQVKYMCVFCTVEVNIKACELTSGFS